MKQKNVSADAIDAGIARLSDPDVNTAVELASTPNVAKDIIQSLPGVKQLREHGPEAEKAVLALLQDERTLKDENLAAISLHILENYPTERVKFALAKPISERRFRGVSSQLAAEAFLKAAGILVPSKDAIAVALREAKKIQRDLEKGDKKPDTAQAGKPDKKKSRTAKK